MTRKELEQTILKLRGQKLSGRKIAVTLGLTVGTVNGILAKHNGVRARSDKKRYQTIKEQREADVYVDPRNQPPPPTLSELVPLVSLGQK